MLAFVNKSLWLLNILYFTLMNVLLLKIDNDLYGTIGNLKTDSIFNYITEILNFCSGVRMVL